MAEYPTGGMRAAFVGLWLLTAGCGRAGYLDELEARHPELAAIPAHRLGDTTPYLLPARGSLTFFLCRWPDAAEIPVDFPPDATGAERHDIEVVLRAWAEAGLGIRFGGPEAGQGIEIRFAEDDFPEGWMPRAASAVADCAVEISALENPTGPVLDAHLSHASIHLARRGRDSVGRDMPYSREERMGALLHEMGHALGFQGHVRRGASVMLASVDHLQRVGRRLIAGEPLRDETVRALYAVPSGTVVGRARLDARRTAAVDRMVPLARARGLAGPFAQVGDRAARILWRDARHTSYALTIWNLEEVLRRPGALALFPEPRAADLLRGER